MNMQKPLAFEAWVGGYLGPSYRVETRRSGILYEVYRRGYELHDSQMIYPTPTEWERFAHDLTTCNVWNWQPRYKGADSTDGTSWYLSLANGSDAVVSRGLNHYPPGFPDFLRSLRRLLGERSFS